LEDDFAGLTYTEEQSAQIAKIQKETDTKRAAVAGSQTLTDEQKNAFLVGYTRLEYGEIYKVLTPEQQKMVRQRVTARHAQEKSEKKAQPRSVQTPKN
jgi:Spy/CpxP family protein refolding chaperone